MKKLILLTLLLTSNSFSAPIQNKDLRNRNMTNLYPGHHTVVLTFDDGPSPETTPYLLNVLAKYNVKATFFMLGSQMKRFPDIVSEVEKQGHIIANHTFSHLNIAKFKRFKIKKLLKSEFFATHSEILNYSPNMNEYFFRAPYGAWQSRAAKIINKTEIGKEYIGPIYWDIGGEISKDNSGKMTDGADWDCWSKKRRLTAEQCLEGYYNKTISLDGGVSLMHDLNIKTAKMVEMLIPKLLEEGFEFKNLDEIGLTLTP